MIFFTSLLYFVSLHAITKREDESMATHNDLGAWGERVAADYLRGKGYSIRHQNWKIGHRDLDIVAFTPDGQTVVVVEVKTRRNTDYVAPEAAVDWKKVRNLASAANAYLQRYRLDADVRFDIITVVGDGTHADIDHLEDAFPAPMW